MTMTAIILLGLKASIVLMVFAIGLKATFADATFLFRRPDQLARALLSMNVLMPAVALVIVFAFELHPAVKIALVAVSVSPIPPIIPNKMLKAGGKEDYTIGLLTATAALSVIVIPVALEIFEAIAGVSLAMRASSVAVMVLATVLAPLIVGILVRSFAAGMADRLAKPISLIGVALLVLTVVPVLIGMARSMLSLIGDGTIISLGLFSLFGFAIGHMLGGPAAEDRVVLALATASRHPAVAIAIAHENFPDQRLSAPAVFLYLLLSGALSALYLAWSRRHQLGPTAETKKTAEV
jgi:bile acid:Na+ symporter, BASS family